MCSALVAVAPSQPHRHDAPCAHDWDLSPVSSHFTLLRWLGASELKLFQWDMLRFVNQPGPLSTPTAVMAHAHNHPLSRALPGNVDVDAAICTVPSWRVMLLQARPHAVDEHQRASEPLPATLMPELPPAAGAAVESSEQTDPWQRSSR